MGGIVNFSCIANPKNAKTRIYGGKRKSTNLGYCYSVIPFFTRIAYGIFRLDRHSRWDLFGVSFPIRVLHLVFGRIQGSLGVLGSTTALFKSFVKTPRAVAKFLLEIVRGTAPPFAGHNLAGGYMVVTLLITIF